MLKYVTSFVLLLTCQWVVAQEQERPSTVIDSVIYKDTYGLRAGVDLASIFRTVIDDEYTGFQITADYRLTSRWYVAGEIGNEELIRTTNQIDYETRGSYLKAGADYNFYRNWLDMDNMIYAGMRVGTAGFSQTLNRYDFYQDNDIFITDSRFPNQEFTGLTAIWLELQAGMKVELFNNFYITATLQLKRLVSEDQPENFDNLYIPGFGRTYDTGEIGVGYSYGISYRIPFYKK